MRNGNIGTETPVREDVLLVRNSLKVCMHVRGVARTDGRVMREATALAANGFAVSILDREEDSTRPLQEDVAGVRLVHTFVAKSAFLARFKPVFLLVKLLEHLSLAYRLTRLSADTYHAHDWMALPACYLAARLQRKTLVFDAHELPLSELVNTRWSGFKGPLTSMMRVMVRYCSATITVSSPIAQEIRERFRAQNVILVRNVHRYQAALPGNCLRQFLNLDSSTRIALYQGNIQADRGLHILVHAAKFLEPDIVIVMMGKGIGGAPTQLEALALSEKVAEHIKIVPPVPYDELLEWTASADIGLILYPPDYSLNVKMCLPNKLFEYIMAGLPVLATQLDAVIDILETYKIGKTVSSTNTEEVGTAISTLLADHTALAQMRQNALQAAQNDLCWEKEQENLVHLYHTFIKKALAI